MHHSVYTRVNTLGCMHQAVYISTQIGHFVLVQATVDLVCSMCTGHRSMRRSECAQRPKISNNVQRRRNLALAHGHLHKAENGSRRKFST